MLEVSKLVYQIRQKFWENKKIQFLRRIEENLENFDETLSDLISTPEKILGITLGGGLSCEEPTPHVWFSRPAYANGSRARSRTLVF